jgi:serine/threonine protein kinase
MARNTAFAKVKTRTLQKSRAVQEHDPGDVTQAGGQSSGYSIPDNARPWDEIDKERDDLLSGRQIDDEDDEDEDDSDVEDDDSDVEDDDSDVEDDDSDVADDDLAAEPSGEEDPNDHPADGETEVNQDPDVTPESWSAEAMAIRKQIRARLYGDGWKLLEPSQRDQFISAFSTVDTKIPTAKPAAAAFLDTLRGIASGLDALELDANTPEHWSAEATAIRKQIRARLVDDVVNLLEPSQRGQIESAFKTVDTDIPTDKAAAAAFLDTLRGVASGLDAAVRGKLKERSDLMVDYERLKPIVKRAAQLRGDKSNELQEATQAVDEGFQGAGVSIPEIAKRLKTLEALAKGVLRSMYSVQSAELEPVDPDKVSAFSELKADYQRFKPIVTQLAQLPGDRQIKLQNTIKELEKDIQTVEKLIPAAEQNPGKLKVPLEQAKKNWFGTIGRRLNILKWLTKDLLRSQKTKDAVQEQSESLPVAASALGVGDALGAGSFGTVYKLSGSEHDPLVGKSFDPNSLVDRINMDREAEMYALLGDHPNIARCYGIHKIDDDSGQRSMLVMQGIEGKKVDGVLKDLTGKYQKQEINREEYLGSIQHLIKGMLMGLAHFEAMGLVHRDIKNDNIMFDKRTGHPILIDMGLSQEEGHVGLVAVDHEKFKLTAPPPGDTKDIPIEFVPTKPPEGHVGRILVDKTVSSAWDSFDVGKILFPLMEQDPKTGQKYQFSTGMDRAYKAVPHQGTELHPDSAKDDATARREDERTKEAAERALERDSSGEFHAKRDAQGNLIGQTLKPAPSPDEAGPGSFSAETQYVDFMNRLTYPDPKYRMTASEALKHPFLAQALLDDKQAMKVLGAGQPEPEVDYTEVEFAAASQNILKNLDLPENTEETLAAVHPQLSEWHGTLESCLNVADDKKEFLGGRRQALQGALELLQQMEDAAAAKANPPEKEREDLAGTTPEAEIDYTKVPFAEARQNVAAKLAPTPPQQVLSLASRLAAQYGELRQTIEKALAAEQAQGEVDSNAISFAEARQKVEDALGAEGPGPSAEASNSSTTASTSPPTTTEDQFDPSNTTTRTDATTTTTTTTSTTNVTTARPTTPGQAGASNTRTSDTSSTSSTTATTPATSHPEAKAAHVGEQPPSGEGAELLRRLIKGKLQWDQLAGAQARLLLSHIKSSSSGSNRAKLLELVMEKLKLNLSPKEWKEWNEELAG